MNIAIVGGGIGGLATALYLSRAGIAVRIYEAARELNPLGVGINLFPHAVRRLYELGLEEPLSRVGIKTRQFAFYTQHGQLLHEEPSGLLAGYNWPHISIHRADLHQVLLDATLKAIGPERVHLGHPCTGFAQNAEGVDVHFSGGLASIRADAVIACDGIHSAIRRQLYPGEGKPVFGGINMWRGVARGKPFLSGATLTRVGPISTGKLVIYPIRDYDDGTQLINWVAEIRRHVDAPNDWSKTGRLEDFLPAFAHWRFPWLDIPALLEASVPVLEYPMVDRDPLPRWTFGRITLLGDAAHPMYPRGGNGAAQAIIDADVLARELTRGGDIERALAAYETARLPLTSEIVRTNRTKPPDHIIELAEQRSGYQPFTDIEAVLPKAERDDILDSYRRTTQFDIAAVNGGKA